jgi:hypothetical protein
VTICVTTFRDARRVPAVSPAKSASQLRAGLAHVGYEIRMAAECAEGVMSCQSGTMHDAYLEAELLHVRALIEFLITPKSVRDNMLPTEYAPQWEPEPQKAARRLRDRQQIIHKRLAHLTWTRIDDSDDKIWIYCEMAQDITDVASAWTEHLRSTAPDLASALDADLLCARRALERAEASWSRRALTASN